MEVPEMAENQVTQQTDNHMTSAAAFVEGGIQEACDDACSICLEEFSESDPSTLTCCRHEFHLQCVLEWCQRSSHCPMCWQPISLKDPTSQELLEAVERERNIRVNPPRHTAIFHHPTLGDFELQHLPVGANDSELEERIIQHLAAAAAMGRTHHLGRREGHRGRPSSHGRPHFLVFSAHSSAAHTDPVPTSAATGGGSPESEPVAAASPSIPFASTMDELSHQRSVQADQISSSGSGTTFFPSNRQVFSFNNRGSVGHPSSPIRDMAGPSDFQSLSESLKSKWNAVSMRYKESISKSTRGWREKLFARNTPMVDLSPETRREVDAGISSISHGMEHLGTREDARANITSVSSGHSVDSSIPEVTNQTIAENHRKNPSTDGTSSGSCAAGSLSN